MCAVTWDKWQFPTCCIIQANFFYCGKSVEFPSSCPCLRDFQYVNYLTSGGGTSRQVKSLLIAFNEKCSSESTLKFDIEIDTIGGGTPRSCKCGFNITQIFCRCIVFNEIWKGGDYALNIRSWPNKIFHIFLASFLRSYFLHYQILSTQ